MTTDSLLAHAAGEYLKRGLKVIALNGKTPNGKVHRHGLHDHLVGAPECDADWDVIRAAFHHPDTTGVGILTDAPYVVVDIDGEEGAVQWAELTGDSGIPDRWVAKTGRGLHLWYATLVPTGTIKLGPKLDLKGQGGYVAAPPSQHFDDEGRPDHVYEWLVPPMFEPPVEVPPALAVIIEDHAFDLSMKIAAKTIRQNAWGPKYAEGDHVFYAQANHDALIEGMNKAGEGNRNAYLHWAAATLSEEGGSDDEFEQLAAAGLAAGLEREEVRRTVRSARRAHG